MTAGINIKLNLCTSVHLCRSCTSEYSCSSCHSGLGRSISIYGYNLSWKAMLDLVTTQLVLQ